MQTRGWICDSQLQHLKLKNQVQILFFPILLLCFDIAHYIFSLNFFLCIQKHSPSLLWPLGFDHI